MTAVITLSLLGSLTLFLGLTALARCQIQHHRLSISGSVLTLLGLAGVGWVMFEGELHLVLPAVLIGILGYCFGHFTTPRSSTSPSVSTPKNSNSSTLP